ncbi:putative fluoride ion transporter CrcB [Clostridia bacterium]|nr:putative fluoride ion transporter CrcB [Clostridia bacterium]
MLGFFAVGAGGFIGSCLRFAITKLFSRTHFTFPFATLFSNVIAGLAVGIIIGFENSAGNLPSKLKLFLTTGLLGGLSTFSTFSLETVDLFGERKYLWAAGNILLNLLLSLLGVVLGMYAARLICERV